MEANKEIKSWSIILVTLFVILWAAFYKESLLVILRTELAIVWMFLLPGYLLFRNREWSFLEKNVMGALVAGAILGIASYYLGLLGLNVRWHVWLIPLVVMLIALLAHKKSKSQEKKREDSNREPEGNQSAEPVDRNRNQDQTQE
ncbi:MAG: hypothetical protein Q7S65_00500 [Nanoarchaeota archaeon]|nr:hypothetical protein [Nanoarchaeota archaeon]